MTCPGQSSVEYKGRQTFRILYRIAKVIILLGTRDKTNSTRTQISDRILSCQNRGEKLINILSAAVRIGILCQGPRLLCNQISQGNKEGQITRKRLAKLNPKVMNSLRRLMEARAGGINQCYPGAIQITNRVVEILHKKIDKSQTVVVGSEV